MDLLGGAEQTGTTDLILTAGAILNRGVGVLIIPGLCGTQVLNFEATSIGTSLCCTVEPVDEVGPVVLTVEYEAAGGLKHVLELVCECPMAILDGFCISVLTGLCAYPMLLRESHSDFLLCSSFLLLLLLLLLEPSCFCLSFSGAGDGILVSLLKLQTEGSSVFSSCISLMVTVDLPLFNSGTIWFEKYNGGLGVAIENFGSTGNGANSLAGK
jgi:hypothetical protein